MPEASRRIKGLPPYLFAQIDAAVAQKKAEGADVISLGIGDPDRPTFPRIVERARTEVADPVNHRYPSYSGLPEFRRAVAGWYDRRFSVALDPDTEVLPLIGSKEGIAHISWAYLDPDDVSLVPDPAYPVYEIGAILSGAEPVSMPLLDENAFLPDLKAISAADAARAKLLFLNYPNNPTGAVADDDIYDEAISYCTEHDILLCHDNAYSEVSYDGYRPGSILQHEGSRQCAIEFHSLSKTYNMTGWRIGFVVGNAAAIEVLGRLKTNIDSGIFDAVQRAGIEALANDDGIEEMCALYGKRRDLTADKLDRMGLSFRIPRASIYVWVKVPDGFDSRSFSAHLLNEAAVVVAPGIGYGEHGEGYFRISLSTDDARLVEALDRMEAALA